MNKLHLIVTCLVIVNLACYGQSNYATRDSIHIFWQPNLKITYNDYRGKPTKDIEEMMDKYGFSASASVGIWSILDIPQKRKDRYKKFEKVYFAPAFERTTSFRKSDDPLQIEMQNIYFDICEVWARWARKELKTFKDSTQSTGALTIFFITVKDDMENKKLAMYRAYFRDLFIEKKTGAFIKWRQDIDKMLKETTAWATSPEECYRFMTQKPIEEGYIQAPTVLGPIFKKPTNN